MKRSLIFKYKSTIFHFNVLAKDLMGKKLFINL